MAGAIRRMDTHSNNTATVATHNKLTGSHTVVAMEVIQDTDHLVADMAAMVEVAMADTHRADQAALVPEVALRLV